MCPLSNQRSRSLRTVTHNPLLCMISQRQPIIIHSNPRCDIVCDVITLTPLSNQSAGSSRVTNSRVVAVETGACPGDITSCGLDLYGTGRLAAGYLEESTNQITSEWTPVCLCVCVYTHECVYTAACVYLSECVGTEDVQTVKPAEANL